MAIEIAPNVALEIVLDIDHYTSSSYKTHTYATTPSELLANQILEISMDNICPNYKFDWRFQIIILDRDKYKKRLLKLGIIWFMTIKRNKPIAPCSENWIVLKVISSAEVSSILMRDLVALS